MQLYLTLHSAVVSKNKNNALRPNIGFTLTWTSLPVGMTLLVWPGRAEE